MENTLENKARFFALYWGQKVYTKLEYQGEGGLQNIEPFHFSNGMIEKGILELKPLSLITDEDAVEVANIWKLKEDEYFQNHHKCTRVDWVKKAISKGLLIVGAKLSVAENIVSFFRLKSYAFDWNGLSVEKQIEYGWIKVVESKTT